MEQLKMPAEMLTRHCQRIVIALLVLMIVGPARGQGWISKLNSQAPLCKALEIRLREFGRGRVGDFWNVVSTDPDLTEPPWEDFDPNTHRLLAAQVRIYPRTFSEDEIKAQKPEETYQSVLKDEFARGDKLQVWHSKLITEFEMGQRPGSGEEQTILQWRHKAAHAGPFGKQHAREPLASWQGSNYLVKGDFSGLDPAVDPGTAYVLAVSSLLLFHEKPYFFGRYGSVFTNTPPVGLGPYCDFVYKAGNRK